MRIHLLYVHSILKLDINRYELHAIQRNIKPFVDEKRKVRRFSRNLYSLFLVVQFLRYLCTVQRYAKLLFSGFNYAGLVKNLFFFKVTLFKVLLMLSLDPLEFLGYLVPFKNMNESVFLTCRG